MTVGSMVTHLTSCRRQRSDDQLATVVIDAHLVRHVRAVRERHQHVRARHDVKEEQVLVRRDEQTRIGRRHVIAVH